ncbi:MULTISPECIES: cell division protein FtsQ/DivIB [Pseudomonadaceae]|jgi:cell division protein FtsQ|uniref:Cell division protein FtsQ n=1 Tax=Pseudomonas saudiphocaensis TaxID=1499686 RepID=A0A078LZP8_9PSED|nr:MULTISPECIES: cell division protein FtsQ/DivIB [Pseudomonadaceae]MBE7929027.1 cell division protein FtsQ/DivIB [Pseudomonas saudiphocaensis]MCF6782666.1 cell division protein FtsQ/DivIB [Stutzerimonas stutzeri]MCF6805771.1 cell division protein FtsQ/DivIB [Stutzerimonas stutzeri]RRV12033.1 cell division protein FtsQ/DivIB [Pseudomonas saudiphocaensis]CDZ95852.1 cell division protein FtsQ [Pseudomonas saudiphocaensis]
MITTLRHSQPAKGRATRKPVQRGASRLVQREPLSARLPRPNFDVIKRILWPLLLLALAVGLYELGQRLMPYADRPISKVSVRGDLTYVDQLAVQERMAPFVEANFFAVDLDGLRQDLEKMPWIAHVEVRRVWPDQVTVHLEEHLPIARWGDEALLNNSGQAFTPNDLARYEHLPQLHGPKRAQQRVMQQYQMLSQMLRPLGFSIERLELRARGSWFVTTGQGVELLLGRDQIVEKMRRFTAIYQQALAQESGKIARIDLRYANGLAVAWHEPSPTAAESSAVAKN